MPVPYVLRDVLHFGGAVHGLHLKSDSFRIVALDWCTSARLKQALLLRGRMKDRHGYVHKTPRTVHCMPEALGQSRVCEVLNHGVRSTRVGYCFR
jgi:hypothetical protein